MARGLRLPGMWPWLVLGDEGLDRGVRRLRPIDLGDRRHGAARLQATVDRLVLGGLSDGDALQRDLRPPGPRAARHRALQDRLAAVRQAAPGDGGTRQGKILLAGAVEVQGQGRIRLAAIPAFSAESSRTFLATAVAAGATSRPMAGPAIGTLRASPTSRTPSDPWRPTSSCPGCTGCSPTSRPGRSASITASAARTAKPTLASGGRSPTRGSTSSPSASTAAEPATPPSAPSSASASP